MRKIVTLLMAMTLAVCFALPAIASPPRGEPPLEAVPSSGASSYPLPVLGFEKGAIVGIAAPPGRTMSVLFAEPVIAYLVYAALVFTVYMLAGLMRRGTSARYRLRPTCTYDPRSRMHALARDQTAGG
ncbi:MAG TPA: hypothetical protein P5142_00230 [Spirochaetia bacterium]|nr:hypothetical protein [Spirochaetia bacterium]